MAFTLGGTRTTPLRSLAPGIETAVFNADVHGVVTRSKYFTIRTFGFRWVWAFPIGPLGGKNRERDDLGESGQYYTPRNP